MLQARFTMGRIIIGAVMLTCLVFVAGFTFASHVFGLGAAAALSLLLIPAVVVGVRLGRRWSAVRGRELVFLAILFCVGAGGIICVVRDWYANGMDQYHAEDVKWGKFEQLIRHDPTFPNVRINVTDRKQIYWVSGTVDSESELTRLRSLASQCGIERRLDGPFAHSVSLTIRVSPDG